MAKISRLLFIISFSLFLSLISSLYCLPALAVLREHHESPGVLRYHAHSSLKDKQGMTWQVVLFPEYKSDKIIKYHLRLVGFPGITEFIHPQPLELLTTKGQVLSAKDLITDVSFAPNVGEFDITNILPLLPEKGSLKLSTILHSNHNLSLSIPESVLIEWQWLKQ